jgi:hypothetical protein
MVVPANPANTAGDEVGVARILPLHENAIATKNRRRAIAFRYAPIIKIDLREDSEASYDPGDWVPIHVHQFAGLAGRISQRSGDGAHVCSAPFPRIIFKIDFLIISGRVASG